MKEKQTKAVSAKRVDIVKVKLVRENSISNKGRRVHSPKDAYELILDFLGDVDREHFVVLCMDKKQPICIQTVHIGSLNASIVSPREILKSAIISNTADILIVHNHLSNGTTPSKEDIGVTKRLMEASHIVGIDLIDHLILCEDGFRSLKESGICK